MMPLTKTEQRHYQTYLGTMETSGISARPPMQWIHGHRESRRRRERSSLCQECHVAFAWIESERGLCFWCEHNS